MRCSRFARGHRGKGSGSRRRGGYKGPHRILRRPQTGCGCRPRRLAARRINASVAVNPVADRAAISVSCAKQAVANSAAAIRYFKPTTKSNTNDGWRFNAPGVDPLEYLLGCVTVVLNRHKFLDHGSSISNRVSVAPLPIDLTAPSASFRALSHTPTGSSFAIRSNFSEPLPG